MPRERVLTVWEGQTESGKLKAEVQSFSERLAAMPAYERARPLRPEDHGAPPADTTKADTPKADTTAAGKTGDAT